MYKSISIKSLLIIPILLAIGLVNLPKVWAYSLANLGLVQVLKAPACDPEWFVCHVLPKPYPLILYKGNHKTIQQAQGWFENALLLKPESKVLRLHVAETAFALGDREKAAQYLTEIFPYNQDRSPLLRDNRYESRLISARQSVAKSDWASAVRDFRLGLAWGDERSLPVDEQDYFLALAEFEKLRLVPDPANIQTIYRLGLYLAQAGDLGQAVEYLNKPKIINNLSALQAARTLTTIGSYHELLGDESGAIQAYSQAFQMDPSQRKPAIHLLTLLKEQSSSTIYQELEQSLLTLGPTYRLGAQGENYLVEKPVTLPGGWTLVGYDLDEEMLEQAKSLELYLWWRSTGARPVSEDWTQLGDYWIQRQTVTNLFPNAGFEWGVDESGIPSGYDREFYGAPEGSFTIDVKERIGRYGRVAVAQNSPEVGHIALVSRKIPVDDQSYYLMSGWVWDQVGSATIGRYCSGFPEDPISPYYIFDYQRQPLQSWVHYDNLSIAFPGIQPTLCEGLLMNNAGSDRPAFWDNIIWARIRYP